MHKHGLLLKGQKQYGEEAEDKGLRTAWWNDVFEGEEEREVGPEVEAAGLAWMGEGGHFHWPRAKAARMDGKEGKFPGCCAGVEEVSPDSPLRRE